MIVTITPNTGIDHTLVVPELVKNKTIRASQRVLGMGGKGTDVNYILGKLGIPSLALGFAAGVSGEKMEQMLAERGALTEFVRVNGETRTNIIVVCEDGSSQTTFTVPTLKVEPQHLQEMEQKIQASLHQADCLVLGGSLPDGVASEFYVPIIQAARQRGIPVLLDASGPAFKCGLNAGPTIIKPNRFELSELMGRSVHTLRETLQAARQVQAQYGVDLVVTLGELGGLALIGSNYWRILPVRNRIISSAGAGDGVLAGLALAYAHQLTPLEGLRVGFALASAILLTPATADFNLEDYERILPQIIIRNIHP